MWKNPQVYANNIDAFIYSKYPNETPTYQSIIRERVLDLCTRKIPVDNAASYLKSGGWNSEFAGDYSDFLQYCNKLEEVVDMSINSTDEKMFTKQQVQKLLEQLVFEFAESAGYPEIKDGEDIKKYRAGLMDYIKQSVQGSISSTAKAQMVDYLSQIREMSSSMLAYIQQSGE